MATYRSLVGHKINKLSSDPAEPLTGQMWYNSTTGTLRGTALIKGWSSASPQIYTNFGGGRAGTQTAALGAGGYAGNAPTLPAQNATTEYNGSSWSLHPASMTTGRGALNGCGTQTAAAVFGGEAPYPGPGNATEEFDGSSWTNGGDLNAGKRNYMGAGTQTSALTAGGYDGGGAMNESEEYNGSAWTAGNTLGTAVYYNVGTGTQTAGLSIGGYTPPVYPNSQNETELYDGTSWTAGATMNTRRAYGGAFGSQTDALVAGGSGPPSSVTANAELYDGTSWAEQNNLSVAKNLTGQAAGGTANSTAGVVWNGYGPADTPSANSGNNNVEEWNVSTNTVTAGAWASGGTMPQGTNQAAGCGTQTAGLGFAGYSDTYPGTPNDITESYEYDGSTWTASGDLSTGRYALAGAGTQTAGLAFGGVGSAPVGYTASTEEYDGSSWTANPSPNFLNQARANLAGAGTQGAAWAAGGTPNGSAVANNAETYNGTSWTAIPTLNTARQGLRGVGTTTAAVVAGGDTGSVVATVEEYNGSGWTAVTSIPVPARSQNMSGIQTNALLFSGKQDGSNSVGTFGYDGTNWSTRPNMSSARTQGASFVTAPATATTSFGGSPNNTGGTATEDFTGETETANITDFSTE